MAVWPRILLCPILLAVPITAAHAHVSERGLVLLMPTEVYTLAGTLTVLLTVILVALVPEGWFRGRRTMHEPPRNGGPVLLGWLSAAVFLGLVWFGFSGSRDPLSNPLTLVFWTVFWMAIPIIQAVFGDVWRAINPWRGFVALSTNPRNLPAWLGHWIALVQFMAFVWFALIHPAPDDPDILALVLLSYFVVQVPGFLVFGEEWGRRAEASCAFLGLLAGLSPIRRYWDDVPADRAAILSMGAFVVVVLGANSFDGLNETFRWLSVIGVNPLEFPGRSAVVTANTIGLVSFVTCLALIFVLVVWIGSRGEVCAPLPEALGRYSLTLLPIIAGYHFAHYLIAFLVQSQFLLVVLSDPLSTGADLLGLGEYYVSTGFLNRMDTVYVVWIAQAAAIVIGHVVAVVMAHKVAMALTTSRRGTFFAHLPLALFMVAYTWLGLWLLSTPTGA